jgi:hypothetical protein
MNLPQRTRGMVNPYLGKFGHACHGYNFPHAMLKLLLTATTLATAHAWQPASSPNHV